MAWFEIPTEDYFCVVRQNDTTLYAYQGNRRDTFTLNGLEWQKTGTSTNSSTPSNLVCVTSPQIPSSVLTGVVISSTLVMACFFYLILKIVRRTFL